MAGTHVGRAETTPLSIIPAFVKPPENGIEPPNKEGSNIFKDDVARSHLAYEPEELEPEPAALAADARALACDRDVLAGESAAPDVGVGDVRPFERGDVVIALHSGPVTLQHPRGIGVTLALEHCVCAKGGLKPKLKTADAAEE